MWISGAGAVIGISLCVGCGTAATHVSRSPVAVPVSPTARRVARTFLETAVARKNLGLAYGIAGPGLKTGISRAEWLKGNNPVTYFPASNLKTAPLKVTSSTKRVLRLAVALKVKPEAGLHKSLTFVMEVDRIRGRWLVNEFFPPDVIPQIGAAYGETRSTPRS
jgi:hypothetical protein